MWVLSDQQQLQPYDQTFWSQDTGGCGQGQVEQHGARGEGLHQGEPDEVDGEWNWPHNIRTPLYQGIYNCCFYHVIINCSAPKPNLAT